MTIVDSPGSFRFRHPSFINNNNNHSGLYMREKLFLPRRGITVHHHRKENNNNISTTIGSPSSSSSSSPPLSPPAPTKRSFGNTLRRALSTSSKQSAGSTTTTSAIKHHTNRLSIPEIADPYHQPLAHVPNTQQDLVLRSLAAIAIERHISQFFSTDELLRLAEHQKEHKGTLWNKVKVHFRTTMAGNMGKLASYPPSPSPPTPIPLGPLPLPHDEYNMSQTSSIMMTTTAPAAAATAASSSHATSAGRKTFGVSLATVVLVQQSATNSSKRAAAFSHLITHHPTMAAYFSPHALVPYVVQNCILALLQEDLKVEGVFRKNGNIRELKSLTQRIDKGDQTYYDDLVGPIQVAALLKRFLRDLPEPLIPHRLARLFLTSLQMQSQIQTKSVLHLACCMLPKPNRDLMQLLCLFMNHVAAFQDNNMMNARNLATILTPNFLSESHGLKGTTADEIQIVELLITYQPEFVMVPDAFANLMHDASVSKSLYSNASASSSFRRSYISMLKLGASESSSQKIHSAIVFSNDSHTG